MLRGMGSSGLAILLESTDSKDCLVTAATCMVEEGSRTALGSTLHHVFDLPRSVSELPLTDGITINQFNLEMHFRTRLSNIESAHDRCLNDCDGVFINDLSGSQSVTIDTESASGSIRFSKNGLVLESQTTFSSARANACVWKGRWMYEATLGTAGIQQLGWATISCPFTEGEGVGDASDSYAYDGRRVRKWNVSNDPYGQPWVPGDVIGCCIDLELGQISFHRNGGSLGLAFDGVRKLEAKQGYFPAISLSHGERCELNFGERPFKHPVAGFLPIQKPPLDGSNNEEKQVLLTLKAKFLFGCLQRLVQLGSPEVSAAMAPAERLRRFTPLAEEQFGLAGEVICNPLAQLLNSRFVIWGNLVPFLLEVHRSETPHDGPSVDRAWDLLLQYLPSAVVQNCVEEVMEALAYSCRTSPFTLANCPFGGAYPFLALACRLLQHSDFILQWWKSDEFESCLEGLLTRKGPNKFDLEALIPIVWWPGSREDLCSETNMRQTATAMSRAISKVEELQCELCRSLLNFVPPSSVNVLGAIFSAPSQTPGWVFRKFLRNLLRKNRGANRNIPPPGLSDNSVLVSVYTVLLHFLSEGLDRLMDIRHEQHHDHVPFLHRGGMRRFPVQLFLRVDESLYDFARLAGTPSYLSKTSVLEPGDFEEVEWMESSADNEEIRFSHIGKKKPCCCLEAANVPFINSKVTARAPEKSVGSSANVAGERSSSMNADCNEGNFESVVDDKPSSSEREGSNFRPLARLFERAAMKPIRELSDAVKEEELLESMLLLYHLGLAQNFKQASYQMQHQIQSIAQLDDTDRQIRSEKGSSEHLKQLKEARALYRDDLIDCVRQCTWYRVCLLSRWKQRGMYATCMWVVQLLLELSKNDRVFSYVPEFYIETLVDCFHALRRSDPPYVSPSVLLQQGLSSFVTFLVLHFNDHRIANPEIRDILLQSISVLVQYKEHVNAFESNKAAETRMAASLLEAFDNRFWIPVSNILLRLCKGAGFGASKSSICGESCSTFFQRLLREKCVEDEKLFSSFLNRLFNTLNWTISEFSVSIKEMQEHSDHRQVSELQQKKCTIMFELSCNLERILEFFTKELPHAFLVGPEMNLIRLCELIMFVLSHTTSSTAAELFDSTLRQYGQSLEKINRATILAPIIGIVLNLAAVTASSSHHMEHDVARALASIDISSVVTTNFQYLLDCNWVHALKHQRCLLLVHLLVSTLSNISPIHGSPLHLKGIHLLLGSPS
ncbi:hypothetical protein O6H91_08G032800 [Diphasiastrum complanatum]|uniref:Uncharacterized protein n=5 Tax=Diphasiastrum complanatum TaxID=34168 RepID=A0ACC2CW61_DIPCM|nr:hypothetical protein O6H91_08G032800 [Diphasiastrum complanatum]KAJ7546268.1 hypothetical protein O6H91_08G032800 [Diphasiastrum complanatum]KAJ7546270.1 hypothetical protein O6H91_08G032800 [Diphasiastrum complanatum]KAJ7546272.1 hypothetical protein O6H91_08G032800 [Diphasiastrum complanatum]KAJ7546274.1 hypothetical protein O6H91_08G032800 [Diphasiastrum complanatum]